MTNETLGEKGGGRKLRSHKESKTRAVIKNRNRMLRSFAVFLLAGLASAVLNDEWIGFDLSPPLTEEHLEALHKMENERLETVPVNISSAREMDFFKLS